MKRDDSLWKAILEDVFDDFLLFFFKEEASQFDLEKGFVFLDKELDQLFPNEQEKSSPKFVDRLVKVFTKTGQEECPPVPFGRGCLYILKYKAIMTKIFQNGCLHTSTEYMTGMISQ